jgi:hypothetical protein
MTPLNCLPIGTRFSCPWRPGLTGTLLLVNASRARVKLDSAKIRTFPDKRTGEMVSIVSPVREDWAPTTEVMVCDETEEI